MSKETWAQFRDRVKPKNEQVFEDFSGENWMYDDELDIFIHTGINKNSVASSGIGAFIPCSLLDAIEQVEKPKFKKVPYYCYWDCYGTLVYRIEDEIEAPYQALYDKNGVRLIRYVMVADND